MDLSVDDIEALGRRITSERAAANLPPLAFKTLPQAAATSVWAAVVAGGEEIGGRYCQDVQVAPVDDSPGLRDGVMSYAMDATRAQRLWAKSEALVGERF